MDINQIGFIMPIKDVFYITGVGVIATGIVSTGELRTGEFVEIIKTNGPDHNKIFTAQVACNGKVLATGEGKTKKQAEMQAAQKALAVIEN